MRQLPKGFINGVPVEIRDYYVNAAHPPKRRYEAIVRGRSVCGVRHSQLHAIPERAWDCARSSLGRI